MTPQQIKVVNYINLYGSITPLDAFRDLGITKLATIVSQLKRESFVFYQHYESSHNRFGEVTHYMRYWLDKKIYERDIYKVPINKVKEEKNKNDEIYSEMFYQGD